MKVKEYYAEKFNDFDEIAKTSSVTPSINEKNSLIAAHTHQLLYIDIIN